MGVIDLNWARTLVEWPRTGSPAAIKSAFHVGFSLVATRAFHLLRVSDFSAWQRSQRARAIVMWTWSLCRTRHAINSGPVKTCKMRCYRDKRRGCTRFAAIHIMARSHFSFAPWINVSLPQRRMEYRETSVTRYSHKAMHFCRALWKITSDRIYAVKQIRVRATRIIPRRRRQCHSD